MDTRAVEPIKISFAIEKGDFTHAGEASSRIKKTLLQLGFSGDAIRRASVAAYEAEMNIVIHSLGGSLTAEIKPHEVVIVAEDCGPGIPDLSKAMQEGYSTAPDYVRELGFGAGMGLPNMRSFASEFAIYSEIGKGTKITMVIRE